MSYRWITLSLAAWATALGVGSPAPAQGLGDMQFFAPAEFSDYGGPRRANEGFFFSFDGLGWAISAPQVTTIGQPSEHGREVWYGPDPADSATQNNTHDTSILGAMFVTGQRWEGGFVEGHQGLLFSAFRLNSQTQNIGTSHMDMVFEDEEWGGADYHHLDGYVDDAQQVIKALPVTFASTSIRNRVQTWGVELSYLLRSSQLHGGGYFECFLGARYLEFNDQFTLDAYGDLVPVTISGEDVTGIIVTDDPDTAAAADDHIYIGTLANSFWRQDAKNHIVGPQIGARWFRYYGRWMLSTEGRFFAGYNSQTLYQTGEVGSELDYVENEPALPGRVPVNYGQSAAHVPLSLNATSFTHQQHENEWSPGVELRVDLEWQWTRNVAIGAGWSGMWMDGIARASNLIDYKFGTDSTMGILTENNRQDVFINGANFRIVVNR
jgi:hypothetical protein